MLMIVLHIDDLTPQTKSHRPPQSKYVEWAWGPGAECTPPESVEPKGQSPTPITKSEGSDFEEVWAEQREDKA